MNKDIEALLLTISRMRAELAKVLPEAERLTGSANERTSYFGSVFPRLDSLLDEIYAVGVNVRRVGGR